MAAFEVVKMGQQHATTSIRHEMVVLALSLHSLDDDAQPNSPYTMTSSLEARPLCFVYIVSIA